MNEDSFGPDDVELGELVGVYADPRRGVLLRIDLPPESARPLLALAKRSGGSHARRDASSDAVRRRAEFAYSRGLARARLDAATFAAARAQGRKMTLAEAVAEAKRVTATARAEPP